ncbi:hypothetical protein EB796_000561 [Bugula neritina]|uniref:Uncharacterized protein n=1 Tax=Bugula neritina TaxID=10212 RepID=A0A7J7KSN9_BUGNE|nr:hypothetical protein EB796_000561 [Bugula neritina]
MEVLLLMINSSSTRMEKYLVCDSIQRSFRGRVPILDIADPEYLRLTMIKDFSSMPNRNDLSRRVNAGQLYDCSYGRPLEARAVISHSDLHLRQTQTGSLSLITVSLSLITGSLSSYQ